MIQLTRINGTILLVNEHFIEIAEETPDTVVTMQNGHRYFVKETVEEILGTNSGVGNFSMDYRNFYGDSNMVFLFYIYKKNFKYRSVL